MNKYYIYMKGYKILLAAFAALLFNSAPCLAQKTPRLGKDPVKNIVKAMSLEEKAALVCGICR